MTTTTALANLVSRDTRALASRCVEAGWKIRKGGHGVVVYPADPSISPISIPSTPSDHRAITNLERQLIRAGLPPS